MPNEALARKCAAVHFPHEASCDIVMCKAQFDRCVAAILSYAEQAEGGLRDDVRQFAIWMSAAMDSKAIERDSRKEPHYLSGDYPVADAVARLLDKAEQVAYDAANRPTHERAIKTAVHLANFCMIIAAKMAKLGAPLPAPPQEKA